MWPVLKGDKQSEYDEIILQRDEVRDISALRKQNWKLIQGKWTFRRYSLIRWTIINKGYSIDLLQVLHIKESMINGTVPLVGKKSTLITSPKLLKVQLLHPYRVNFHSQANPKQSLYDKASPSVVTIVVSMTHYVRIYYPLFQWFTYLFHMIEIL